MTVVSWVLFDDYSLRDCQFADDGVDNVQLSGRCLQRPLPCAHPGAPDTWDRLVSIPRVIPETQGRTSP